ncbi:DNase I-like protein [Lepidopterella palustris CBS 459.81]|uniref:DNA-(apurinic or apyrimidinic site) endonuclease 2 n=1 Tax=Lepidopterella palustris CBS 459.81 TaxID=1314670 RepID=A0A8E2EG21_9PEZI|nr:DNase I-like protein [Lepidopterella palustris CBS 459.81]
MALRITTWNVNGIRNPFSYKPWSDSRFFNDMFDILEADIVVMQELKIQRKDLRDDMVLVPGWDCYFSLPKHKKGYSGVGIYTRQSVCAPIRAEEGLLGVLCPPDSSTSYRDLPEDSSIGGYPTALQIAELGVDPAQLDAEGRCVVLEFQAFVLFGVYSPANSNGLRDDYRYGFITALDTRIRNLEKMGKRVILTGDLNVSREAIDTAHAEERMIKEGISLEEYLNAPNRRIFNQLLEDGKVIGERDEGREKPVLWDICRGFHQGRRGMFTHWEQKINARPGNFGSRIDYVLCSIEMKQWFSDSNIQEGLMGSDHCPVYATFKQKVNLRGEEVDILDIMNPPGMFKDGKRLKEYTTRDLLALSGKLLPEFDKRRSIKDMFSRNPSFVRSRSSAEPPATPTTAVDSASETQESDPASVSNTQETSINQSFPPTSTARSTSSMASPEKKRRANESQPARPAKKSKSSGATSNSPAPSKGQQSLKGFFKPKSSASTSNGAPSSITVESVTTVQSSLPLLQAITDPNGEQQLEHTVSAFDPDHEPSSPPHLTHKSSGRKLSQNTKTPNTPSIPKPQPPPSPSFRSPSGRSERSETDFIDPIVSKESWTKLFTKKPSPRCEGHEEPCITFTTKKPGVNCGRQFWICPRPLGPSGNKERGTQWRCCTFIWASDWNGGGES